MRRRPIVLAAIAFVLGAAVAGSLLYEGDRLDRTMGAVLGTDARVLLRVENVGSHDLATSLDVLRADGGTLFSDDWVTPQNAVRSRSLEGRLSGDFVVRGQFSWSDAARRSSGDAVVRFSGSDCGANETILVTFRVDSSNGMTVQKAGASCIARPG